MTTAIRDRLSVSGFGVAGPGFGDGSVTVHSVEIDRVAPGATVRLLGGHEGHVSPNLTGGDVVQSWPAETEDDLGSHAVDQTLSGGAVIEVIGAPAAATITYSKL